MSVSNAEQQLDKSQLMRKFLKKLVNDDLRAKQLFRLYYDRGEISEQQFFDSISHSSN